MRGTEKSLYIIFAKILSDQENLLKPKNIEFEFIGFNPNTEIEETSTNKGELILNYDNQSVLTKVTITNGLQRRGIQKIIDDNFEFFQKVNFLNATPWNYLREKLLSHDSQFTYPIERIQLKDSITLLEISSIDEMDYCKNYFPEAYQISCFKLNYHYNYESSDFKLKITFPFIIIPNPKNKEVFSKFIADFIYKNYIEKEKIISFFELRKIFKDVDFRFTRLYLLLEKGLMDYTDLIRECLLNKDDYDFLVLDELVEDFFSEKYPTLLNSKYPINYVSEGKKFIAILKLGSSEIQTLYQDCPKSEDVIEIKSSESTSEKITFYSRIIPARSKNSQILLLKFLLMQNFGKNPLLIFQEFYEFVNLTVENWNESSNLIDQKFTNFISKDLDSIKSPKFLEVYKQLNADAPSNLTIIDVEANRIKSKLTELTKLSFSEPLDLNTIEKTFKLSYFISLEQVKKYLEQKIIDTNSNLKFLKDSFYGHRQEVDVKINKNLNLKYNLFRIIEVPEEQDENNLKEIKRLFIHLFQKSFKKEQKIIAINQIFEKFQDYYSSYVDYLLKNDYLEFIPFNMIEGIKPIIINEFHNSGYQFFEDILLKEIQMTIGGKISLTIDHLNIPDVNETDIWYELTKENYTEFKSSNISFLEPISINIIINNNEKLFNVYFLPRIDEKDKLREEFVKDFIKSKFKQILQADKIEKFVFKDNLNESLQKTFEGLKQKYDLVRADNILANRNINKFISQNISDKNFLEGIIILDKFIFKKLEKDKILKKYDIYNPNKIQINPTTKQIDIQISKKQLNSFKEEKELKYIIKPHELKFKAGSENFIFQFNFVPLDQFALYPFELLTYYYKDHDNFSPKNFNKLDFEQFKDFLINKYEKSENFAQIEKIIKSKHTFEENIRNYNNSLKELNSTKNRKNN